MSSAYTAIPCTMQGSARPGAAPSPGGEESRQPAARGAEGGPPWEWVRVLVFLVQTALIVQGHDPGKPDGLMGPKTMLAMLAWSAASGPPCDERRQVAVVFVRFRSKRTHPGKTWAGTPS